MFALAWIFLADQPEYRTGLIIVGLARCIAMVIIWNDLACGDREAAAVLVALNSVFQVVAFGVLGWFYLSVLPGWLGLSGAELDVSAWDIAAQRARSSSASRCSPATSPAASASAPRAATWYEDRFLPRIGPAALYGLLFTIVILFALQGDAITSRPLDVVRIALPLLVVLRAHVGRLLRPRPGHRPRLRSAPPRWRSPPPATTSNSPSPSRSAPSASPPARPSPGSSAR